MTCATCPTCGSEMPTAPENLLLRLEQSAAFYRRWARFLALLLLPAYVLGVALGSRL